MSRIPTPREMRQKLPAVEPNKHVLKLLERDLSEPGPAEQAVYAARSQRRTLAATSKLESKEESKDGAPAAVTGALKIAGATDSSKWVTSTGRYRMGPLGIPMKFSQGFSGANDFSSTRAPNGSSTLHASRPLGTSMRSSSIIQPSRSVEESKLAADGFVAVGDQVVSTTTTTDPAAALAGMDPDRDTVLQKDLQLLVALIGIDSVMGLGLRDLVARAREPEPSGAYSGGQPTGAVILRLPPASTAYSPSLLEDSPGAGSTSSGLGFLRVDEGKLPLYKFDDSELEAVDTSAASVLGAQGFVPLYTQLEAGRPHRGWLWAPCTVVDVRSDESDEPLFIVEFPGDTPPDMEGADPSAAAVGARRKAVRRTDICFLGEDREVFATRLALAMRRREASKAGIRFQFMLDSLVLPEEYVAPADSTLASLYTKAVTARAGWAAKNAAAAVAASHESTENDRTVLPNPDQEEYVASLFLPPAASARGGAAAAAGGAATERLALHHVCAVVHARAAAARAAAAAASGLTMDGEEDPFAPEEGPAEAEAAALALAAASKRQDAVNPCTGLPNNASVEAILTTAAADVAMRGLLGEAVMEHETSTKAATVHELLRRADASAVKAVGAGLDPRSLPLAGTTGLPSSAKLEAFTHSLVDKYTALRLPPPPVRPAAPYFGKAVEGLAPRAFAAARRTVAHAPHTEHVAAIRTIRGVHTAFMKEWGASTFFDSSLSRLSSSTAAASGLSSGGAAAGKAGVQRPVAVRDYVRAQATYVQGMSERLVNAWPRDVSSLLMDGLPQPHFNVYEQEMAGYEGSPLERIIRRVELYMSSALGDMVGRTCSELLAFAATFAATLPSGGQLLLGGQQEEQGQQPALGEEDIAFPPVTPLFEVSLVLKKPSKPAVSAPASSTGPSSKGQAQLSLEQEEKKDGEEEALPALAPATTSTAAAAASSTGMQVGLSPSRSDVQRALLGTLAAASSAASAVGGIEKKTMSLLSFPADRGNRLLLPLGQGDSTTADLEAQMAGTRQALKEMLAPTGSLMIGATHLVALFQRVAWLADAEPAAIVAATMAKAVQVVRDRKAAAAEAAKAAAEAKEAAGKGASSAPAAASPPASADPKARAARGGSAAPTAGAGHAAAGKVELELVKDAPDADTLFAEVLRFHEGAAYVASCALDVEDVGLLRVKTGDLRRTLASRALAVRNALLLALLSVMRREAEAMHGLYQEMLERLSERPTNEEELLAIKAYLAESEGTSLALEDATASIHARMARMGFFGYMLAPEDFRSFWSLREWPVRIAATTRDTLDALEQDKARMIAALEAAKLAFEKEQESLEAKVTAYKDVAVPSLSAAVAGDGSGLAALSSAGPPEDLIKVVQRGTDLEGELRSAQEKADDFNARERAFGFPPTPYTQVKALQDDFEPYFGLWTSLSEFMSKKEVWVSSPIQELDAGAVEGAVSDWWTMSYRLMKSLGDAYPGLAAGAKVLRGLTDEFRRNVPIIRCLASKALEPRHWATLSDRLGRRMNPAEEDVIMSDLLAAGILAQFETVEEISVQAEKEHSLKKALDAMKREWDAMVFDCAPYRNSGTFLIRGTDEVNQLLDDQIVKTQTMLGSPYIKPNLEEASKWEKLLVTVQQVMEEWLAMQRTWMYLEPIFSSEDIMRQMPTEGRRFASVDKMFRNTMKETMEQPLVLIAAGKDKMLDRMRESNKMLDAIQKGLNDYLELKRLAFPRFFFLSNDELLEILSQTKDPRAAQPHLGKCFEGISKIAFRGEAPGGTNNPDDLAITHMISAEGETIPLVAFVDPNSPKAKGNVEVWFTELQRVMRLTVKDVCKQALLGYPKIARNKWVLQWPGQVVLNISQLYWTQEVEAALNKDGTKGLLAYEQQLNGQLQDIVDLVRGKLSKMERTTLGALTVIDVHARDVINQMAAAGVSRVTEFDWQAQLRYYWEDKPDTGYDRYGDDPMNLVAKIVNASQLYGYEYLGNSSRLVITPLTDRCYRTLMSAVYLTYGGAPAGPAGTGKTETTKDLAKAIAIQCVVFNCSDGLDYLAMAKFFKGLAASGAWACFDEFNRIELEVLSVVAQQVLTVQKAKRARVAKFNFEGTILPLNPDANAFITMNPGYAGRSELPDNLKALFRPVAMMVPDYALISEIKLYSFGFSDARNMARKLTQVLRLSSEQLSSQRHYDYGMRAVFSILVRAGNLRQALGNDPAWSEDKIVLSAVNDVNVPKFTSNDLPLFRGITSDLFPGVVLPLPDYRVLMGAITGACRSANLQPKDEFTKSVVQLYETVQVRHGLMLVGETGCGKTAVLRTLQSAMSSVKDHADFTTVHVHSMNPKSISQGQLYGNFDDNTHEWTDGVLAVTYRNASRDTSGERHWIMFDGPVDAVWIENMNTVLDDNKKLCLNSGEIIKMTPAMTMMFETDNLAEASPATVSRCGMVYMEPRRLGWRPVFQSWMAALPRVLTSDAKAMELLDSLFEWIVPPTLAFVANFAKQLSPVSDLHLIASLCRVYGALLERPFGKRIQSAPLDFQGLSATAAEDEAAEKAALAANPDAPKAWPDCSKTLEGLFLLALVWTVGGVTDSPGRTAFSAYLKALLAGKATETPEYKDFKSKAPLYDGHLVGGGQCSKAGEGDARAMDWVGEEEQAAAAAAAKAREESQGFEPIPGVAATASRYRMKTLEDAGGPVEARLAAVPFPDDDSVYDFVFAVGAGGKSGWKSWTAGVPPYKVPEGSTYQSIIVPTIDTIRSNWLLDLFMTHGQHVLCVGETGTGKSVTLKEKLLSGLDREVYQPIFLNFSAQTSANQTQDIIDGRMGRRRKGVFGPALGQRFVIMVDDLNMPAKEKYGAQPPIEILRQWMDHSGWYDRRDKDQSFMELVDIQFCAAMGPPGGGRTFISQRYVRHFNVLGFVPFSNESLQRVFTTILSWSAGAYSSAVKGAVASVVGATTDVYNAISREMLPTPAKSHYTFNLRDISKVFQGMNGASEKKISEAVQYFRLWAHECLRVFHDRLTTEADRKWFINALAERSKEHFKKDWLRDVRGPNEALLFGNFVDQKTSAYEELADRAVLSSAMAQYLEDYNSTSSKPLTLVLFGYAVEHVARISRVINQPGGNALLVGVGGSGRKSLCTLAAFMAGMRVFSVEISKAYGKNEWRDDLKKVLQMAGREGKHTVFLFSDTQIVKESFVEDINNILNNGEVPNLFPPDEKAGIIGDVQMVAKKEGKSLSSATESWAYFVDRVKARLHVVLCFSPIGDAFRTRLRMFPSLVNCCTIDWFTPWPEEGLRSVADHFLSGISLPGHDGTREGVIDVCVDMQMSVTALSTRFLTELRRYYYVTPTSYLELLNTFKGLIEGKKRDILGAKQRYEGGIDKIVTTEAMVDGMKTELIELQPKLKVASAETDAMIANIEVVSKDVNAKAAIVAEEEKVCGAQAAEAGAIKSDCETQLAEAIPILEGAVKALAALSKSDIQEIKALGKPPFGVRLTGEACCILFGIKPVKKKDESGAKVDDYWEPSQKVLLSDAKLLDKLMTFKDTHETLDEETIKKISPYVLREDFAPEAIEKVSKAAGGLCKWVHATVKYDKVAKVVAPKKAALAEATAKLEAAQTMLASKQAELKKLQDNLASLQAQLNEAVARKNQLAKDVEKCANRLDRAQRLVSGLGGEKVRWQASAANLQLSYDSVVGDVLLASGMIAYLGAFTAAYREECAVGWAHRLGALKIPCSAAFKLANTLGDPVQIRTWTINKLPNDSFSIDNAIMLYNSGRWPLCIDPQRQANKWIRNSEAARGIKVVKQSQGSFVRTIESSIQFGTPVLLENVPETLDPVLEPLLARAVVKIGGVPTIRLGDSTVEYDPNFRLYITTVLPNPHYPPETCVKVNLLNFMATQEGLQDQMLGIVVKIERPDLEEQREKLILEDAENKRQLKELEDKILHLLASSTGNILDDEVLIATLAESKVTSNTIMRAVEVAERTQAKIATARLGYVPVAKRVALLFFCIADLSAVDPMYQYSLEFYIRLFLLAIDKAPPAEPPANSSAGAQQAALEKRLTSLKDTFTYVLYENVCRSLFEKDKLLFSFLLCTKVAVGDGRMDPTELRFFLQGSLSMTLRRPNPVAAAAAAAGLASSSVWLTDRNWADVLDLRNLPGAAWKGFDAAFESKLEQWTAVSTSADPVADIARITGESTYSPFQRLLILRCLRPDKVVASLQAFIASELGQTFIEPPPFSLQKCYDDSAAITPLVFVLSSGADPMAELMKLADRLGKGKKLVSVSLGQGQGPIAERNIAEALESGAWVCLQNCHLAESWLPTLERICEESLKPGIAHDEFRLWLTAMPSPKFPVAILQNGVKMTLEPPKGIRANMQGSYLALEPEWLDSCSLRPGEFRRLVFGLCFFHAALLERRKFGPLGWNKAYDFSDSDLRISLDQLHIYLSDASYGGGPPPFPALAYLTGECNYGGRVTDDMDRRTLMALLSDIYADNISGKENAWLDPSGAYMVPSEGPHASYIEAIKGLPLLDGPEVFGLHSNADITTAIAETGLLLGSALALQPRAAASSSGDGAKAKSYEETLGELAASIAASLPALFDIEAVSVAFPVSFHESQNTVLVQECMRFNGVLAIVQRSLVDVGLALKGRTLMTAELEAVGQAMVQGRVPEMWKAAAYPSLKPLGSWVNDFNDRLGMLRAWIEQGKPSVFWVSGFFFTQSFLTGVRQNYSRKHAIPIDELGFTFRVLTGTEATEALSHAAGHGAAEGAWIRGLFLQGVAWNADKGYLCEARPRELFSPLPVMLVLPERTSKINHGHAYPCPIYKTSERFGILSTSGHSTNFVMTAHVPMDPAHSVNHWVKRGAALITQLDT